MTLASQGEGLTNVGREAVALSPGEAGHLLSLLEQFANSRLFLDGAYFTEGLANGDAWSNDRLKEIYLAWKVRRGRTRVASSQAWREFMLRAGFNFSQNAWMWPKDLRRNPLRPMTFEHFLAMERRLAAAAGLHPRVAELLVKFVEEMLPKLEDVRERKAKIREGSIRKFVTGFIHDLKSHTSGRERQPMTRSRVVALSTIVMDTAALF